MTQACHHHLIKNRIKQAEIIHTKYSEFLSGYQGRDQVKIFKYGLFPNIHAFSFLLGDIKQAMILLAFHFIVLK